MKAAVYEPMSEHARLYAARSPVKDSAAIDYLRLMPTSSISEADLFVGGVGRGDVGVGLRRWARTEQCACGGAIRVLDADDEVLVASTIRLHNATSDHVEGLIAIGWARG